ncbi:MAG: TonB-dependent receptor [Prevotellaceae bacterium]|nr:TonB-dependent receptor [Prevotellaceae bacterium]
MLAVSILCMNLVSFAQGKITVTGTVTDADGIAMPAVSVVVKGGGIGKITDADGKFSIDVPYGDATLVFSFIGFQSQEIPLRGQTGLHVVLEEDVKALSDVVVFGYSSQRKETLLGSLASMTTKDLVQSPTANINNALAGRLPGLMVNQFGGGEPGVDKADIYVRGLGTYGNKAPIVIVDGVEREMSYLTGEEIETFTILKDAAATAQYGVRGANGVVVVTTKRGKAQEKATVKFKASLGVNQPVKFPAYLGSADYATLYNEAALNDYQGNDPSSLPLFDPQTIENFRKAKGDNSDGLGYNWDYFDYAFQPGIQQDYNLSVRGGSDRARYYVSANYYNQGGNYTHTELEKFSTQAVFKRYNFRSNIDIDVTDKFYVKLDLGARITDRTAPGTTASRVVQLANTQPPYLPIVLPDNGNEANSTYVQNNPEGVLFGDQLHRFNILGELSRTGFLNEKKTYLDGNFTLGYDLDFVTDGLKIEGSFAYDAEEGRWINRKLDKYDEGYREYPSYATFMPAEGTDVLRNNPNYDGAYKTGNKYDVDQTIGNKIEHNAANSKVYYQMKMNYNRTFAGVHEVSGLLLFNRSIRNHDQDVDYRYQGLTGRATYYYDSRYLLEFNFGYNGSENFAKGHRYGFFPAVSAGWVITNEPFLKPVKWLNNLKIRASHGLVGSDNLPSGRWHYLQFFNPDGDDYRFGPNNFETQLYGIKEDRLSNPTLSWETARKTNIGLDVAVLSNRLELTVDAFYEYRYNIFTELGSGKIGFPDIVGKDAPLINSGEVENKGIDFEIGWTDRIGKDFKYYAKLNFAFARNQILFQNEISYEEFNSQAYRASTGRRIDEQFVYLFDHFIKDQDEADRLNESGYQSLWGTMRPGDAVYKDLNGDGKISDYGDRTACGNPRTPEIHFGIPLGFQYKGFDFSVLLQGAANASVLLEGAAVWDFPLFDSDKTGKVKAMHLNRWTPETAETATYPALSLSDRTVNKNPYSSLFLYDAKYLRLKNMEIGYTLPGKWVGKLGLQQIRVYAQGLNLFTWDGLDEVDIDPETRNGSGDWYPVQKVYNFGVDITF